jgi:hypothetical protein
MGNRHVIKKHREKTEQEKKIEFVLFVIYAVAAEYGRLSSEVFDVFEKYSAVGYFMDCYDVLHTQGEKWLVAEAGV